MSTGSAGTPVGQRAGCAVPYMATPLKRPGSAQAAVNASRPPLE